MLSLRCLPMKPLAVILAVGLFLPFPQGDASATQMDEFLYNEVLFLRGVELGSGGRALALGGAYRALSDDLSALTWNPAGLASVRRIEISLGLAQVNTTDDAVISDITTSNQLSRTRLNELGLVFPVPTYRGSLVFGLGYQQVHSIDSFGTFVQNDSLSDFSADEMETGRLGMWSLGMGIDISPTVSAGLALRLWTGYNDYSYDESLNWSDGDWETYDQSIDLDLSGFSALTGVLVKPTPWLRLGASLESPLKLKVEESYHSNEQSYYDEQTTGESFSGSYVYHLTRSFRAGLGVAGLIGPVVLTSDAVLNDWSQITYNDEPSFAELTRDEANREIAKRLKPTLDLHFGAEFWVPQTPVRLQAGYGRLPSPFKGDDVISDKDLFSGGMSVLVDQALLVQTTVVYTSWHRDIGGWGEDLQLTHLQITLAYRF